MSDASTAVARSRRRTPSVEGGEGSRLGLAMALPPTLLVGFFIGLPVVLALGFSLGFTGGLNSVAASIGLRVHEADAWWGTLAAYREVFATPQFLTDLGVTLAVTAVSTVVVILMALGIGLYARMRGGVLPTLLSGLAVIPLFIPVVIASWAILTFYSADGFLRTALAHVGLVGPTWSYTLVAVVIGSVWTSLPFAVLMVASGLQAVPDALIEAARDAGAGFLRIAFSIMVPMAAIPIVIASTFTAIGIIGSFTVPYFTGPNSPTMLGVSLTQYFTSFNEPQQSIVMAFTVFVAASAIGGCYVWANFRSAGASGRL